MSGLLSSAAVGPLGLTSVYKDNTESTKVLAGSLSLPISPTLPQDPEALLPSLPFVLAEGSGSLMCPDFSGVQEASKRETEREAEEVQGNSAQEKD